MATFFLSLQGDQLGTFSSISGTGNGNERVVTLNYLQAIGSPDDVFTLRIDQANAGERQFANGQRITIIDSDGNIILNRVGVQPDIEQGLGAGDQHLIINQRSFYSTGQYPRHTRNRNDPR